MDSVCLLVPLSVPELCHAEGSAPGKHESNHAAFRAAAALWGYSKLLFFTDMAYCCFTGIEGPVSGFSILWFCTFSYLKQQEVDGKGDFP